MMIYRWRSEALKDYAPGSLIAVAGDAEEARAKIRAAWPAFAMDQFYAYDPTDPDDQDRFAEMTATMERDLAEMPEQVEEVIFIMGGA